MPREKINNAPEYVKQLEPAVMGTIGRDPAVEAEYQAMYHPELGQVASGIVGEIHWKNAATGLDNSSAPGAWVPDEPITRDAVVFVNWRRDDWAQVGIEGDPAYFRMAAQHPGEAATDGSARTCVYTPPLSRDELNKMIRALRRARDQVYGSDE